MLALYHGLRGFSITPKPNLTSECQGVNIQGTTIEQNIAGTTLVSKSNLISFPVFQTRERFEYSPGEDWAMVCLENEFLKSCELN